MKHRALRNTQHNCPSVCFWLYACDVSRYMWLCHKIKQRFSQSDGPNPRIGHWTLNICFHFLIMHQASQYFFLTITPIKWFSPSLFINWSICTPYNQINISEKMFSDQKPSFIKGMISDCLDLCRLFKSHAKCQITFNKIFVSVYLWCELCFTPSCCPDDIDTVI